MTIEKRDITFQMLGVCHRAYNVLPRASSSLFAAKLLKAEWKTKNPSIRLLTTSLPLSRGEGGYGKGETKRKYKGRLEYLNRPDPCEDKELANRPEDDLLEWQVSHKYHETVQRV